MDGRYSYIFFLSEKTIQLLKNTVLLDDQPLDILDTKAMTYSTISCGEHKFQ